MVRLSGNFVRPPAPPPLPATHIAVTRSMTRQGIGSPLTPAGEFTSVRLLQSLPPLAGFENPGYQRTPPPPLRIATPAAALQLTPLVRRAQQEIQMRPNIAQRPVIASPPMGSRVTAIPRLQNRLAPPRPMPAPRRQPPVPAADIPTAASLTR